jgi:hypothetical protein
MTFSSHTSRTELIRNDIFIMPGMIQAHSRRLPALAFGPTRGDA